MIIMHHHITRRVIITSSYTDYKTIQTLNMSHNAIKPNLTRTLGIGGPFNYNRIVEANLLRGAVGSVG